SASSDEVLGLGMDPAGSVYVSNTTANTTGTGADYGNGPVLSAGSTDVIVVKYNSTGVFQWRAPTITGAGAEFGYGCDADGSKVVVGGTASAAAVLGGGSPITVTG